MLCTYYRVYLQNFIKILKVTVILWVLRALSLGEEQQLGHEPDHSPPSSSEVKK